jgi:hypothetical protein
VNSAVCSVLLKIENAKIVLWVPFHRRPWQQSVRYDTPIIRIMNIFGQKQSTLHPFNFVAKGQTVSKSPSYGLIGVCIEAPGGGGIMKHIQGDPVTIFEVRVVLKDYQRGRFQ